VQPRDPAGTGLAARDLKRGRRRIDAGDRQAPLRQQAGQRAGPAADVHHGPGTELGGHGYVDIEIAAIGVQRVVELGEPWLAE
jgi:hypothetical protein